MKGKILIGVGAVVLIISILMMVGALPSPLVTLNVEPIVTIPADGQKYTSLPKAHIEVPIPFDENCLDVTRVFFWLDPKTGDEGVLLNVIDTSASMKIFEGVLSNDISEGTHTFSFRAYSWRDPTGYADVQGNTYAETTGYLLVDGAFSIDVVTLNGKWYIGQQEVLSPSQTITIRNNNPLFKFAKTSTSPEDSAITCTVTWTGSASGSKTLTYQGNRVWSDNIYLKNGSYDVELKATDGTRIIQMSIGLGIGEDFTPSRGVAVETVAGGTWLPIVLFFASLVSIGIGVYWERES